MNQQIISWYPETIAIGSTNPTKVEAVHLIVRRIWPQTKMVAVEVASGVSAMPMSSEECLTGARNRALNACAAIGAELGIGLEGGVNPESTGLMLLGWAVIVDREGRESVGGGARLPLPPAISRRVLAGEELGPIMDEILGQNNVRQKGGAVGALTGGLVLRKETFAVAVAYALAPFVSPHLYEG